MTSFWTQLEQAQADANAREADPLRAVVERTMRGMDAISTNALLDLIGLPSTTGNSRRVARTMRGLGYVAVKSRRFVPGGWRDTVTRGWARPVRSSPHARQLCSMGSPT